MGGITDGEKLRMKICALLGYDPASWRDHSDAIACEYEHIEKTKGSREAEIFLYGKIHKLTTRWI